MSTFVVRLSHGLLAAAFFFSGAIALAVPKAAESEEEMVTFGEAGAPPKPVAKHVIPATRPPAATAGKQSAGKPAKRAGSKSSAKTGTRSAGTAAKPQKQAAARSPQSGKPPVAKKETGSAKSTAKGAATTVKTTPVQQAPGKQNGSARKK